MNTLRLFIRWTCFLVPAVILFASTQTFAQTTVDVLYLKNGSIIRGTVIEQVIGESVKIRTADGNIFVYRLDEIQKMTKEESANVQATPSQSSPNQPLKSRLGLQVGLFSIAADNFDKIYGSSSSFTFGIEGQWLFSEQFGTSSRFRYFSKKGEPLTYTSGGATITNQTSEWTEYWLVIGGKAHFRTSGQVTPFIGIGAAYFNIKESISGTFSYSGSQQPLSVSVSEDTWGLALFGGGSISVSPSVFVVVDAEFTTASVKGSGGVGGSDLKVGGFFISAGIEFAF